MPCQSFDSTEWQPDKKMNQAPANKTTTPNLISIPVELRLYTFAFLKNNTTFARVRLRICRPPERLESSDHSELAALSRVNKQLHAETHEMLYSRTLFRIDSTSIRPRIRGSRDLSLDYAFLRNLEHVQLRIEANKYYVRDYVQQAKLVVKKLLDLDSLKTFTFSFSVRIDIERELEHRGDGPLPKCSSPDKKQNIRSILEILTLLDGYARLSRVEK